MRYTSNVTGSLFVFRAFVSSRIEFMKAINCLSESSKLMVMAEVNFFRQIIHRS